MTPILQPVILDLEKILDSNPDSVWIDSADGRGTVATTPALKEQLGVDISGYVWQKYCDTKTTEAYQAFTDRKDYDEVWTHTMRWKNPSSGKSKLYHLRATWVDGNIHGVVANPRLRLDPRRRFWIDVAVVLLTFLGGFIWGTLYGAN